MERSVAVNEQELERLAARMVSGPHDAVLYARALEAAAVTRRGLELLQEVAEIFEGTPGSVRALAEPEQVDRLRPGDRLAVSPDPDGEEAPTDLLDRAVEQLGAALASGSVPDLAHNLGRLTDERLREQVAASVAGLLEALPPGSLDRLREEVERWPDSDPERPFPWRLADALLPPEEGERGDRLRYAGDRLRDAAALLKVGKEMLHEMAGLLPAGGRAEADPLALLGREVAAVVTGELARLEALEVRLAGLTDGLAPDGRPVGLLAARLAGKDAGELAELADSLGLGAGESGGEAVGTAEPRARWPRRRLNLGQLARALQRVPERRPTIAAAWEVLSSPEASFARRWAAGVHLCRLTRELVRSDPAQAAAWAARVGQAAGALAAGSGPAGAFESRMADFLGTFASAHVGNSLRVQGHLLVAERFFLPWEEDDHLGLRAEYLALKATLRYEQRRPSEAINLFEEADRIASRGGFPGASELAARIRIAQARSLAILDELDAAVAVLRTTLKSAPPAESAGKSAPPGELSPRLRYIALQNLADCLSKAGQLEAAAGVLDEADEVGSSLEHPEIDLLRAQWIRARLERGQSWLTGVDTLRAVRQRFLELELVFDAALASLELAQWHAAEIRGGEADDEHVEAIRVLAAESAAFFAGQDVGPEAVAALALFQHVSTVSVPSLAVLRKIERLLRQAASL
jgi:tetratricopeptide (TPR) repeat protein